ncbi:Phosphate-binding protein PstS [bacterium HR08]|nr:Phosphate-binding protein PstS [bacterium HR08]
MNANSRWSRITSSTIAAVSIVVMSACSSRAPSERARAVTVKGSDTMVILGQRWAEIYMQKHPGAVIQVTGGGSGTGIAALINGTTDIAQSSRPIKPSEAEQVKAKFGVDVIETPVALDGLAVYVHESNPVSELSLAQLKAIYTGRLTNWKEVGGPDLPIVLYSRENNSGTYVYFKEHVLENADFAPTTQTLPGTAAVINAVAKDPKAIGYGGVAYGVGIKTLKIKKDDASPAIAPTLENVATGRYPISRELYFYTVGKPGNPVARDFIRWVLSPEGQAIVKEVGYYPLPEEKRHELARRWEQHE